MKKLITFLSAAILIVACNKYDDTWIKDEFADINDRLTELEEKCKKLNTDITSLQSLVKAIQQNDFVTEIKEIKENGQVVGYEICFSKSKSVKLYHGKDGADGHVPQISVKQDGDGIWYWTIDGNWMTDDQGNKVSTLGREDLVPQMKIQDEYWYISYDNCTSWTKLGKAVGEDGKDGTSYFKDVQDDDEYVYITLTDDSFLKIPKISDLEINFDQMSDIPCNPGQTIQIPYSLSGVTSTVEIITICEGEWNAKVNKIDQTTGYIVVNVPAVIDDSQIVIAVSDSRKTIMKALTFTEGVFSISDTFVLSDNGGELSVSFSTNYDYEVTTNASWIYSIETKAVRNETIVIKYKPLPEGTVTRSAEILFTNSYSCLLKKITVLQGSPVSLSSKNLELIVNDEYTLSASSLLGHTDFIWYSSDSDIVRVNANGMLTAIGKGSATITAMTSDYNYSATCVVTVCSIDDIVTTKFGSATNISYSNGIVGKGSQLSWYIYNNSTSSDIVVNYIQVNDATTGRMGNIMDVSTTLAAGENAGWIISLGSDYYAPYCRFYFTYNGKEYTQDCESPFH